MNPKRSGRVLFNPFFQVRLVQMLRHDEAEAAVRVVAGEVLASCQVRAKRATDAGGGLEKELLEVPCRERQREMERAAVQPAQQAIKRNKENDRGWEL